MQFPAKNYNLTQFQISWVESIEAQSNFEQWVLVEGMKEGDHSAGPIVLLWYADGVVHGQRIGINRKLGTEFNSMTAISDSIRNLA